MNVYTDPKLLDVYGALDSLPSLDWKSSPSTERQTMRATGTDVQDAMPDARHLVSLVAPPVVPNIGKRGQSVSFAVISSDDADEQMARTATHENLMISSKKALPAVFASKALKVSPAGVEPATFGFGGRGTRVPSGNLSEVAASGLAVCTSVCTSEPPKRRKRGADAAAVGGVETPPTEVKPEPVETDFAAALKMLAMLPLSDEERAEAVRRLLKGCNAAR